MRAEAEALALAPSRCSSTTRSRDQPAADGGVEEHRHVELGRGRTRVGLPAVGPARFLLLAEVWARDRSRSDRSCRPRAPPRAARCSSRARSRRGRRSQAARCSPSRCPGRAPTDSVPPRHPAPASLARRSWLDNTPWSACAAGGAACRSPSGCAGASAAAVSQMIPSCAAVGLGVCLRVALAAGPEALLDVGHQRLIVGVDHERQTAVRRRSRRSPSARHGRGRRSPACAGSRGRYRPP